MISMSLALAVVILAWKTRYRWIAVIAASLYVLLVGISRLYLGVHYPSDVLGGWCISVLWILTLYHVLARFSAHRRIPFLSK
jgi:undecaprenyl-diphosphatase